MTYRDYDDTPPSARDLAIELNEPAPRREHRSDHAARYGGLRVDSQGYDRDGNWYVQLDGGGQE